MLDDLITIGKSTFECCRLVYDITVFHLRQFLLNLPLLKICISWRTFVRWGWYKYFRRYCENGPGSHRLSLSFLLKFVTDVNLRVFIVCVFFVGVFSPILYFLPECGRGQQASNRETALSKKPINGLRNIFRTFWLSIKMNVAKKLWETTQQTSFDDYRIGLNWLKKNNSEYFSIV